MSKLDGFEYNLHFSPLCQEVYPEIPDDDFMCMANEYIEDTSCVHIFPYIREASSGNKYIDIYVWSLMIPNSYERFVLAEGCRLSLDKELEFLGYIRNESYSLDHYKFTEFCKEVKEAFPNLNYSTYTPYSSGKAFEHLYFASHESGIKEILYKAGLSNIAYIVDLIPDINLIGRTPSEIIHDLPMKILRVLNNSWLIKGLENINEIGRYKRMYEEYCGFIGDEISVCQLMYLYKLSIYGQFGGRVYNRTLYNRLADSHASWILDEYEKYFELTGKYRSDRRIRIPKVSDIERTVERLETITRLEKDGETINKLFRDRILNEDFEYRGDEYSVIMPESYMDMCDEAYNQHNCLMEGYIEEHAYGYTTILFLRPNYDLLHSYVTMEVEDREIRQVYDKFNFNPSLDVLDFLDEYATKKGFKYNPERFM